MAAGSGVTERLARACSAHPWRTIGAWLFGVVAAGAALALLLGELTTEGHPTNNPESQRAASAIGRAFPPRPENAVSDIVLLRSNRYTVDSPPFRAFVQRLEAQGRETGAVSAVQSFDTTRNPALVSKDRHATALLINVPDADRIGEVVHVVERADADPNFAVAITGDQTVDNDFNELSQNDLKNGELRFGVPAALVILVLVFGAVVAGLIPLLMAILSIVVALGLVALFSQAFDLSVFITNMLTGMGLALGIDYSLFVVSRYREERGRGLEKADAIAASGATASRAVLFSGTAFVVAMMGMLIVPNNIMRSLALGAILVGIVSVVAALTLLPALLGLLGDRVNALRVPFIGRASVEAANPEGRFWHAIVERVMRRPALSLTVAAGILVAAAIPLFGLHIGASGVSTLPDSFASKRGFVALERDFPRLTTDPVEVVVADGYDQASARAALERLRQRLAADPRFGSGETRRSPDGSVGLLSVPIKGDSAGTEAVAAVRQLRSETIPDVFGGTRAKVYVGGDTAENIDYFDSVSDPAPIVLAFVLGLTLVLLTIVFRSVIVAATALVLNLLSVGAAYGLLVLVFQHGVGAGLFGFTQSDTIEAWVPLFLFSVLFGLSMDYQVFLLSRIKERRDLTRDTNLAVSWGVSSTARIITGAALIIVAVFLGFAMGDLLQFQQMGFGVAVALLVDATIIRSVILPSIMALLGRWNWYLPRWLEWLPRVEVEGAQVAPTGPAAPTGR
jgi:putative drug exporter of the RND superfamily